jgi:hypothetical protein
LRLVVCLLHVGIDGSNVLCIFGDADLGRSGPSLLGSMVLGAGRMGALEIGLLGILALGSEDGPG